MSATLDIPKPTHREEQPVRRCLKCGCYQRSFRDAPYCEPCGRPDWELTDSEVIQLISEMPDVRARRKAFDALAELHEELAA